MEYIERIRNFVIIAHIDHGKSTLADRFLELTGTVDARKMKSQYLDQMELERERGITIKMAPVRMIYHPDRGSTRIDTRINADSFNKNDKKLLYEDLTYKIRGAIFNVYNSLGPSHKELVYGNALAEELDKLGVEYEREKSIDVIYNDKKVGIYRPDFIIDNKIILEIKSKVFIDELEKKQIWNYLRGSDYRLAMLVNFGQKELEIKRIIYDSIRENQRVNLRESAIQNEYILNLIDTPGHPDFSYEVSRALAAVEGAILLVDGTQGIQAQTLSNFYAAQKEGLKIIGAVNKIDIDSEEIEKTVDALANLLGVGKEEIHRISAKTGHGVKELLDDVILKIPPPQNKDKRDVYELEKVKRETIGRGMIFDSFYDDHKGIIVSVRVFDGEMKKDKDVKFIAANHKTTIKETGFFSPELKKSAVLREGELGYVVTGIKDTNKVKIGDTIVAVNNINNFSEDELQKIRLPGYMEPKPVVFVSFFPNDESEFDDLKNALEKLKLNDSAFVFEPDYNEILGRGFKGGFLGRLHFEIVLQRLNREFNIETTTSFPSVEYLVKTKEKMSASVEKDKDGYYHIRNANDFPYSYDEALEPMIKVEIISPGDYIGKVMQLKDVFRFEILSTQNIGDRTILEVRMPLAELITDFDDKLKSVSRGMASFTYEFDGYERAELERLDVLVAGKRVPGISRVVIRERAERIAREMAKKLKDVLPRQQFSQAIQVMAFGRIIARETIPALKKDVTGHLYGGDRTRKMKLWKKQKEGKKKLKEMADVRIAPDDFKKLLSR